MTTPIIYKADLSVTFGDTLLIWGTDRQKTRALLNDKYEIQDNIIDLSQYHNGDNSHNIIQRRDIYKNYNGQDNLFFLNFDLNDTLAEIELYNGFQIDIEGVVIDFSMDIEKVAKLLDSISIDKRPLSEGEYFFKDLKLKISSSEALGGDGNEFSYFYCGKDVSHLVD